MLSTPLKIIGLFICTVFLTNCKKEGCTDETALNYNPKANVNDFSCTYAGEPYIGTYGVTDTLQITMLTEISKIYQKVSIVGTNSDTLYLMDYRNTDDDLIILMEGSGFNVPEQEIWGGQIIYGHGLFRNDSLFYEIIGPGYDNRGRGSK